VLAVPLFGDRERWGQKPFPNDPCWQEWVGIIDSFYKETQHGGVRKIVNYSGYKVMRRLDLSGKTALEIGPGLIAHKPWWQGLPSRYDLFDFNEAMMAEAVKAISAKGIEHKSYIRPPSDDVVLPMPDGHYDVVISFYSLEHLHPLERYVAEMVRVLKPGGHLIGAIPCEGGVGWGMGRLLSTRRWFKKNSTIDPDKLVCWEHPNFADAIMRVLGAALTKVHVSYWPLRILPVIDLNLILKFVYQKQ
jgi:SAM-dependent methyltransferase